MSRPTVYVHCFIYRTLVISGQIGLNVVDDDDDDDDIFSLLGM